MSTEVTPLEEYRAQQGAYMPYYEAFVEAYCTTAMRRSDIAAIQAGITEDKVQAKKIGGRLAASMTVRRMIDARLEQLVLSAVDVMAAVSEYAQCSLKPFIDDKGEINMTTEEAQANIHLLRKYSRRPGKYGEAVSIEAHDPLRPIEFLLRHYKLIGSDVAVDVQVDVHTASAILDSMPDKERELVAAELAKRLASAGLQLPAGETIEEYNEYEDGRE